MGGAVSFGGVNANSVSLAMLLARAPGSIKSVRKFGQRSGITTTARQDVWTGTATTYPWPTAAAPVRVRAGGSAADAAAGAGARKILVGGLDANWSEVSEEITLAGAGASAATAANFIRVFRAVVTDVGTYGGDNTGDIVIESTAGVELAHIPADYGQTRQTMWTMPAGHTGVAIVIDIGTATNKSEMRADFHVREQADAVPGKAARRIQSWLGLSGNIASVSFAGVQVPEKTDLWLSAGLEASPGTGDIFAAYEVVYWPTP